MEVTLNKESELRFERQCEYLRSQIIGRNTLIRTPLGRRRIVYADYTASGRALQCIENLIAEKALPTYGNVHTYENQTGKQTAYYREEARGIVGSSLGLSHEHCVIFVGAGSTGAIGRLVQILSAAHWRLAQADIPVPAEGSRVVLEETRWGFKCTACQLQLKDDSAAKAHLSTERHRAAVRCAPRMVQVGVRGCDVSRRLRLRLNLFLIDPTAHHSSFLPFREQHDYLVSARPAGETLPERSTHVAFRSAFLALDSQTATLDIQSLVAELESIKAVRQRHANDPFVEINVFCIINMRSNVTGIGNDIGRIQELVRRYGAVGIFDGASKLGHAHMGVSSPKQEAGESGHNAVSGFALDILVLSPHKMIGGPATSGVLVIRKSLLSVGDDSGSGSSSDEIDETGVRDEKDGDVLAVGSGLRVPGLPGGGSVRFVSRERTLYALTHEAREEAGTPDILACIKAGLVFRLNDQLLGVAKAKREIEFSTFLTKALLNEKNIHILGPVALVSFDASLGHGGQSQHLSTVTVNRVPAQVLDRSPCISFLIKYGNDTRKLDNTMAQKTSGGLGGGLSGLKDLKYTEIEGAQSFVGGTASAALLPNRSTTGGLYLHHQFVSALLNDLFGIQSRPGCACAGPYSHSLLGLTRETGSSDLDLVERFMKCLEETGAEVLRPGFTRISLHYSMSWDEVELIAAAVQFVANVGWKFLPFYSFDVMTGEWTQRVTKPKALRSWLSTFSFTPSGNTLLLDGDKQQASGAGSTASGGGANGLDDTARGMEGPDGVTEKRRVSAVNAAKLPGAVAMPAMNTTDLKSALAGLSKAKPRPALVNPSPTPADAKLSSSTPASLPAPFPAARRFPAKAARPADANKTQDLAEIPVVTALFLEEKKEAGSITPATGTDPKNERFRQLLSKFGQANDSGPRGSQSRKGSEVLRDKGVTSVLQKTADLERRRPMAMGGKVQNEGALIEEASAQAEADMKKAEQRGIIEVNGVVRNQPMLKNLKKPGLESMIQTKEVQSDSVGVGVGGVKISSPIESDASDCDESSDRSDGGVDSPPSTERFDLAITNATAADLAEVPQDLHEFFAECDKLLSSLLCPNSSAKASALGRRLANLSRHGLAADLPSGPANRFVSLLWFALPADAIFSLGLLEKDKRLRAQKQATQAPLILHSRADGPGYPAFYPDNQRPTDSIFEVTLFSPMLTNESSGVFEKERIRDPRGSPLERWIERKVATYAGQEAFPTPATMTDSKTFLPSSPVATVSPNSISTAQPHVDVGAKDSCSAETRVSMEEEPRGGQAPVTKIPGSLEGGLGNASVKSHEDEETAGTDLPFAFASESDDLDLPLQAASTSDSSPSSASSSSPSSFSSLRRIPSGVTNIPKHLRKSVSKAIADFNMIEEGDRILVGVSGGKDSLSLVTLLLHLAAISPVRFSVAAATVDPQTPEYDPSPLIGYFAKLKVPFHMLRFPIVELAKSKMEGDSYCAFCARMKRGLLYSCMERESYNKLALGQHLDDICESFLMSAFYNGQMNTMKANYATHKPGLRVIRPLVFTRENELAAFAKSAGLPVIAESCPACFASAKERAAMKHLLASVEFANANVFSSLMKALRPLMAVATVTSPKGSTGPIASATARDTDRETEQEDAEDEIDLSPCALSSLADGGNCPSGACARR